MNLNYKNFNECLLSAYGAITYIQYIPYNVHYMEY